MRIVLFVLTFFLCSNLYAIPKEFKNSIWFGFDLTDQSKNIIVQFLDEKIRVTLVGTDTDGVDVFGDLKPVENTEQSNPVLKGSRKYQLMLEHNIEKSSANQIYISDDGCMLIGDQPILTIDEKTQLFCIFRQ